MAALAAVYKPYSASEQKLSASVCSILCSIYFGLDRLDLTKQLSRSAFLLRKNVYLNEIGTPETTRYLDRLSINYPPISDAFDNREYFSALYKQFNFDIIEK